MKSASIALLVCLATTPAFARGPTIAPEEFQLYMDWKDGREDPRLEKDTEAQKLAKISKSLKVSVAALKKAIARVEPVAAGIVAETKAAISEALGETALKGRVLDVTIDAADGHVVAWVKWRCGDVRDTDKEAALVGWATRDGGNVVGTLALWCVNENDTKLFSAKIGRTAFDKISKDSVERFATSRYIKLFEDVKRGPHT